MSLNTLDQQVFKPFLCMLLVFDFTFTQAQYCTYLQGYVCPKIEHNGLGWLLE